MDSEQAIFELEKDGKQFSDEQLEILRTEGGIDLLAVAGSGKTFTMTNLIAKRLMTGEIEDSRRILCTTFSKAGVEELETRLNALLARHRLPRVEVTTIHAACYEILRQFGIKPSKVLAEGESLKLLREAAKCYGFGRMSQDDLMNLANTISIQYNTLMTDAELVRSEKWMLDMDVLTFSNIREKFQEMKGNIGAVDFDDMQRYVYDWLCVQKYPAIVDWCRSRWRWLFIDEFQDTNPIQLQIITAILGDDSPSERLVVVGDDDQCVYEFRGTDPRILINICGNFDLTKRYLSTNYRCPSEVVDMASKCVVNMGEREIKSMRANRDGGKVALIDIKKLYTKSKEKEKSGENVVIWNNPICIGSWAVANKIYDIISGREGACGDKAVCVLSRNNATMRILANMLYSMGVSVKGQKNMYISSAREWGSLKRLIKISAPDEMVTDVSDIIWQIIPSASIGFGTIVSSVIVEAGCSVDWALEKILTACYNENVYQFTSSRQLIDGDPYKKGNGTVNTKTMSSATYEIGNRGISADSLVDVINALRIGGTDGLIRLIDRMKIASAFMYKTTSQRRLFDSIMEYFIYLVKTYGVVGLTQYMKATEQFEEGRFAGDKRVELRTIHGAKGGEWDTVFILMDDNIEFPSLESIQLMMSREIDIDIIKRYVDSERRLHYVAQTRASRRLYFVCDPAIASMFILESLECNIGNEEIIKRSGSVKIANTDDERNAVQSLVE